MDPLHHLPLTEIDPHALLRDRTALDPQALHLLQHSIACRGPPHPHRGLATLHPPPARDRHTPLRPHLRPPPPHRLPAPSATPTIPAFLRAPQTIAQALASMVTENEIREPVTPWEKAALILNAIEEGHFDTPDHRHRRPLPRTAPAPPAPESATMSAWWRPSAPSSPTPTLLTTRQLDTLAAAIQSRGTRTSSPPPSTPSWVRGVETQWSTLRPVLMDVLREPTNPTTRRPRRLLKLRQGLTITREPTPSGWLLRFSGPQAKSPGLADDVMTKVEEWFGGE